MACFKSALTQEAQRLAPSPAQIFPRVQMLRTMSVAALANYLEQELGDGVPVSWYDWLTEEV